MATRRELLESLQGLGGGISKMGQMMMERERYDTKKALDEEEAQRQRELFPSQKATSEAGATTAKTQASSALIAADKNAKADAANQTLFAANEADGWKVDPADQSQVGTWKAELNALNRFRARENKPAMSVPEYVLQKQQDKLTQRGEAAKTATAEEDTNTQKARTRLLGKQADTTKATRWSDKVDDQGNIIQINPETGETRSTGVKAPQKPGAVTNDPEALAAKAAQGIDLIDQMIGSDEKKTSAHPGFTAAVGAKGLSSFFGLKKEPIAGTDAADFKSLLNQVTGQAFLEARQALKGGGAITDMEGSKAQTAITRMSEAQSEQAFKAAAKEFRDVLQTAKDRAEKMKTDAVPTPAAATPAGPKKIGRFTVESD